MIKERLKELSESGNYRTLRDTKTISSKIIQVDGREFLNFSTNDYLALSDTNIQKQFIKEVDFSNSFLLSNPSSRLMCGNSEHYAILEESIAAFYGKESSLVLSSGFMVNSGVLPALTTKQDLIIADKKVHASIIEGMRLSDATSMRFKHNSISHLKSLLEKHGSNAKEVWVVVESIYSMDGDISPLYEICELKKVYNFKLYVDEAHAFGVRGKKGCGILEELGLLEECDITVATLGKAASSVGGFVVCTKTYREYLINKMRTLIFSTALAPINLMWSRYVIDIIEGSEEKRTHINNLRKIAETILGERFDSHIIPIVTHDNFKALELVEKLKSKGYLTTAIRYPTVSKGDERVRISLNASMSETEITNFFHCCQLLLGKKH